jgi:hypothetical protein
LRKSNKTTLGSDLVAENSVCVHTRSTTPKTWKIQSKSGDSFFSILWGTCPKPLKLEQQTELPDLDRKFHKLIIVDWVWKEKDEADSSKSD